MILCCRLDKLSCRLSHPDNPDMQEEKGSRNRSEGEERYQCILRKESKVTEGKMTAKHSSEGSKASLLISEGTRVEEKEPHGPVQGKTDAQ